MRWEKNRALCLGLLALTLAVPSYANLSAMCRRVLTSMYHNVIAPDPSLPAHHQSALRMGFPLPSREIGIVSHRLATEKPSVRLEVFSAMMKKVGTDSRTPMRQAYAQFLLDSGDVRVVGDKIENIDRLGSGDDGIYYLPGSKSNSLTVLLMVSDIEEVLNPEKALRARLGHASLGNGRLRMLGQTGSRYQREHNDDPFHFFAMEVPVESNP